MAQTFSSKPKKDQEKAFIDGSVDDIEIKGFTEKVKKEPRKLKEKTILKGFRIPEKLDKDLKHLSVDLDRSVTSLVIEALNDLIDKYYEKDN